MEPFMFRTTRILESYRRLSEDRADVVVVPSGVVIALAWFALTRFGGDLGAGFFSGMTVHLHQDPAIVVLYFALGAGAAVAGCVVPAWKAAAGDPAPALKAGNAKYPMFFSPNLEWSPNPERYWELFHNSSFKDAGRVARADTLLERRADRLMPHLRDKRDCLANSLLGERVSGLEVHDLAGTDRFQDAADRNIGVDPRQL
jgi:hypothetical protein